MFKVRLGLLLLSISVLLNMTITFGWQTALSIVVLTAGLYLIVSGVYTLYTL